MTKIVDQFLLTDVKKLYKMVVTNSACVVFLNVIVYHQPTNLLNFYVIRCNCKVLTET